MASSTTKKYTASHKFARIAPRKARLVADMIRGKGIEVFGGAGKGDPDRKAQPGGPRRPGGTVAARDGKGVQCFHS